MTTEDLDRALTTEQQSALADLVIEHAGSQPDFATFCDCVLLLFEDIPGFETQAPDPALLRELWRRHCARPRLAEVEGR